MSAGRAVFGSCQERRLFPLHYAPDRMGNQMARQGEPHICPGCYDNHEFGTIIYNLQKKPESKRGCGLSARTAARFPPCDKLCGSAAHNHWSFYQQTWTPSPQQYQQDQTWSRVPPPGKTPFNSTTQRFKSTSHTAEDSPGPGTYTPDAVTNKKVSWPTCFGRPDWSRLPQLEKKSLRVKPVAAHMLQGSPVPAAVTRLALQLTLQKHKLSLVPPRDAV